VKEIPLFIAFSLLLAGVSFGTVYTKDSVITQEETSPQHMKRMMSLYTLTKSLGSSIGSTVMGYVYYLSLSFVKFNIYNVIMLTFVLLIALVILWLVTQHKESMR
jgi:DHA2 family multidrug resistance protein-like MFS transporter